MNIKDVANPAWLRQRAAWAGAGGEGWSACVRGCTPAAHAASPRRRSFCAALRSEQSVLVQCSAGGFSRQLALCGEFLSWERRHAGASLSVSSCFWCFFSACSLSGASHALGNRSDDRGHGGPGSALLAGALLSPRRRALQPLHQSAGSQEINGWVQFLHVATKIVKRDILTSKK